MIKLPKNVTFNINVMHSPFESKALLYAVFIFSLIYVFHLAFTNKFTAVSVFLLVGFISSFFTKNMIYVLGIAMVTTMILPKGVIISQFEGFEDAGDQTLEELLKEEEEKEEVHHGSSTHSAFGSAHEGDDDTIEHEKDKPTPTNPKKAKREKMTTYNDSDLERIQEQTKELLDTHTELIKNVEKLKPFLQEATDFSKTLSKFMDKSQSTINK
jgi:hypothetical protein